MWVALHVYISFFFTIASENVEGILLLKFYWWGNSDLENLSDQFKVMQSLSGSVRNKNLAWFYDSIIMAWLCDRVTQQPSGGKCPPTIRQWSVNSAIVGKWLFWSSTTFQMLLFQTQRIMFSVSCLALQSTRILW
jgi:hypothetical protein